MSGVQQRSQTSFDASLNISTTDTRHSTPTNSQASGQADDEASDSGYASFPDPLTRESSIAQASDIANTAAPQAPPVNPIPAAQSVPILSGPVIHHAQSAPHAIGGLRVWSTNIPLEAQDSYSTIYIRLGMGIRDYLTSKKKPTTLLAVGLRLLGNIETTAKPYIVVFCHPKSRRRAEKFIQKTHVRRLYQVDSGYNFNICIDSSGLERTALETMGGPIRTFGSCLGDTTIEVLFDESSSFATIGGDVFLNFLNGTSERYGLTANHVFNLVGDARTDHDASSSSDSESSEWSIDDEESDISVPSVRSSRNADSQRVQDTTEANMATTLGSEISVVFPQNRAESMMPRRMFDDPSRDPELQTESSTSQRVYSPGPFETLSTGIVPEIATPSESNPNRVPLGTAVTHSLTSDVARNRDWALIEYTQKASNNSVSQKFVEAATFDPRNSSIDVSVIFRGVTEPGRLCVVPTCIILPGGTTFVDVYTFSFEQCPVDLDGISGSWVSRESNDTMFVYGQVVAKDRFGNLYVVPMVDILLGIQQIYPAGIVSLYDRNSTTQQEEEGPATLPTTQVPPTAPIGNLTLAEKLASRCLELMSAPSGLRRNICSLPGPGTLRSEIGEETVAGSLPLELQNACRYWVEHLERSKCSIADGDAVHVFLQMHFLHWLEAMSLIGETSQCLRLLRRLQALVALPTSECAGFLSDADQFVLHFHFILAEAPLQVYGSALIFAPEASIIRKTFVNQVNQEVKMLSGREIDWGAYRSVLAGRSEPVTALAFSLDGKTLASASQGGMIKLWDTETGKMLQTFRGHINEVTTIAFSPDGKTLALASWDDTVNLWDVRSGKMLQTLKGNFDEFTAMAFSPDGKTLALASWGDTVYLWDTGTGRWLQTLEGYSGSVTAVAFSPDSKTLALASQDGIVRLWDLESGKVLQTLEGHSRWVTAMAFSPDGKTLALASWDEKINLWDAGSGKVLQTLTTDSVVRRLWFNNAGDCLYGEKGILLTIGPLDKDGPLATHMPIFLKEKEWVCWNGKKVLRLPYQYRDSVVAIHGNIIGLGCDSGRVLMLRVQL